MLFGVFVCFAVCERRYCLYSWISFECPDDTNKISNMSQFEYWAAPQETLYLFVASSIKSCQLECDRLRENTTLTIESGHGAVLDLEGNCPKNVNLTIRHVTVNASVGAITVSNLTLENVEVWSNCRLSVDNLQADLGSLSRFQSVESSNASFNLTSNAMPETSFDVNLESSNHYRLIGPSKNVNLLLGQEFDTISFPGELEKQVRLLKSEQSYTVFLDLTCSGQTISVSHSPDLQFRNYPTLQISMYEGTSFSVPEVPLSEFYRSLFNFVVFGNALITAGPNSYFCSIEVVESGSLTYKIQKDSLMVPEVKLTGNATLQITADHDPSGSSIMFAIEMICVQSFQDVHLICWDSKIELSVSDFHAYGCASLANGATSTFTCNTTKPLRLTNSLTYREATVAFDRVSIGVLLEVKYELSLRKMGLLIFNYVEKTSIPVAFQISYADNKIPTDDQVIPFLSPVKTPFFLTTGKGLDASVSIDPDVKVDGFSRSACLLGLIIEKYRFAFELTDYPSRVSPSFCYGDICRAGRGAAVLNHDNFSLWKGYVSGSTQNIKVSLNSSMVDDSFDFGAMANVRNANLHAECLLKDNRCKFKMSTNAGLWESLSFTNIELVIPSPDKPVINATAVNMRNASYISQDTIDRMVFCPKQVRADISSIGLLPSYINDTYKTQVTIVENHLELLNISMDGSGRLVFSDIVGCYKVTQNENYLLEHRAMKLNVQSGNPKFFVSVMWNVNSSAESPAEINFEGEWLEKGMPKMLVVDPMNTDLHISSEDGTIPLMFMHTQRSANITLHNEERELNWTDTLSLSGDTLQMCTTTNTNKVIVNQVIMSDQISTIPNAHKLVFNSDNIVVKSLEMRSGLSTFDSGVVDGDITLEPLAIGNFSNSVMSSSTVRLMFNGTYCALMLLSGNSATEGMPKKILVRGYEPRGSKCRLITAFQNNRCQDLLEITELESNPEMTVNGNNYKASLQCQDHVSNSTLFLAISQIPENPNQKLIIAITVSCSVVLVLGLLMLTIVCVGNRLTKNDQNDDSLYVDLVDSGNT